MPPKDKQFSEELFAIDSQGNKYTIGTIESLPDSLDFQDIDSNKSINKFYGGVSFEFCIRRSLVYSLDVRIGHKYRVPNNWLKRHHIPMNRRHK
jgi:hypothetical protein